MPPISISSRFPDRLRVRYRYDGVLHEVEPPPARLQAAIISRIKIMARLDIAERRLPQDGRIKLTVRGHEIDFRVSTVPALYGETVVLRVLDRTAVEFDYSKLGLPQDIRAGDRACARIAERHGAGHRADRQRQDDDALYRPLEAEHGGAQDRHRRGPDRIPARRHQPDPGQAADRAQFRQPAALDPAPGSRRDHDRRNPRSRNRADRGAGGADRPSGAVDPAHQLGRGDDHAAARHGARGLSDDRHPEGGAGAAAGPAAVPGMQNRGACAAGADRAVRPGALGAVERDYASTIRKAVPNAAAPAFAGAGQSPSCWCRTGRSTG